MRTRKIEAFQIVNGTDVLEFGPRYRRPQDDTIIMSVFHRTTGHGVSWLIERDAVVEMADRLASSWDSVLETRRDMLRITRADGFTVVRITQGGSGQARSISLTRARADQAAGWLRDKDAHGWTGWRSGRSTP